MFANEQLVKFGSFDHHAETKRARTDLYRRALAAAGRATLDMRANGDIGDDAFHQLEEELDWIEMANSGSESDL